MSIVILIVIWSWEDDFNFFYDHNWEVKLGSIIAVWISYSPFKTHYEIYMTGIKILQFFEEKNSLQGRKLGK
jgi:hypothetical protein